MITQEELKELFTYCEETGNLIRKASTGPRARAGDIAGSNQNGYIRLLTNGKNYYAHRIIWVMVYGSIDSKLGIDHINGIKDDNRINNLRLVTQKENLKNKRISKSNKSGVVGVWWHKVSSKWIAQISVDGKRKYLGVFTNKEDAIKTRQAAEIEYDYHENHGRG